MNRIKELRNKAGLRQEDLAKKLNIAQNTLSYWESGKTEPSGEALIKLADILGTTTDNILGRDETGIQHVNDDETLEFLDELHKRPEMKALFKVGRKATKEDVETAITVIEALKKKGNED
jgi:transcriptional regulator with XRE-family HTH domain